MIVPPPGAIINIGYNRVSPVNEEAALAVYPDGAAWYWSLAGAVPASKDRVGAFRLMLNRNEINDAQSLATRLFALPPPTTPTVPTGTQLTMTVANGGQFKTYVIYADDRAVPSEFGKARDWAAKLIARAEKSPYAALALAVRGDFLRGQNIGSLTYNFENPGKAPIKVLLRPETFYFRVQNNTSVEQEWRAPADRATGLIDAMAMSLGGIYTAATLTPGQKGMMGFVDVINKPSAPGRTTLVGTVRGMITLDYPNLPPSDYPGTEFLLEAITRV